MNCLRLPCRMNCRSDLNHCGQVNKVVKELLSNDAACPEQIVAIIDMRDASAFSMLRRASLLSEVAATLCKVTCSHTERARLYCAAQP